MEDYWLKEMNVKTSYISMLKKLLKIFYLLYSNLGLMILKYLYFHIFPERKIAGKWFIFLKRITSTQFLLENLILLLQKYNFIQMLVYIFVSRELKVKEEANWLYEVFELVPLNKCGNPDSNQKRWQAELDEEENLFAWCPGLHICYTCTLPLDSYTRYLAPHGPPSTTRASPW